MLEPPFVTLRDAVDPDLVQVLRRLADEAPKEVATIGPDRAENEEARKASVGFLALEHWTTGLIFHFGMLANSRAWRFDVRGVGAIQATSYRLGGHHSWHTDTGLPTKDGFQRKLTVILPLSDPREHDGGCFELLTFGEGPGAENIVKIDEAGYAGSVLVFPAYMPHRVTPLIRGARLSIVAWLIGPPFK